jgi:hypothetical protein
LDGNNLTSINAADMEMILDVCMSKVVRYFMLFRDRKNQEMYVNAYDFS